MTLASWPTAWSPSGGRPWRSRTSGGGWPRRWSGSPTRPSRRRPSPGCTSGGRGRGCSWRPRPSWPTTPSGSGGRGRRARGRGPAAADGPGLPAALRGPPARVPARLPAAEQRAAAPPGRRRRASTRPSRPGRSSTRAGMPRRALRPVWQLGLGWAPRGWRRGSTRATIRERIAARYPEAQPLPDRPELDRLLGEVGLDVAWDERPGTYRRPIGAARGDLGLDSVAGPAEHAPGFEAADAGDRPAGGRGPAVRGAAPLRPPRRVVPRADGPAQPDGPVRAGAAARSSRRWSGSRSTACCWTGSGRGRPRTRSTGGWSSRPTAPRRARRTSADLREMVAEVLPADRGRPAAIQTESGLAGSPGAAGPL